MWHIWVYSAYFAYLVYVGLFESHAPPSLSTTLLRASGSEGPGTTARSAHAAANHPMLASGKGIKLIDQEANTKGTGRVPEGCWTHTHTHNVHLSTCRVCVSDIHKRRVLRNGLHDRYT